jgi:hypothetical protein
MRIGCDLGQSPKHQYEHNFSIPNQSHSVVIKRNSIIRLGTIYKILTISGKTAIRTILGPQYAKIKKAPKVADEDEAKVLLSKILPK